MFTKDLSVAYLLDFYGDVLSDRKKSVLDDYYNNDLSLAEIAADLGISRQGVRELIKKAEEELNFYEQKLHLAQRFGEAGEHAAALRAMAVEHDLPDEVIREIRALEKCIG
ncbi:MAG: DNA-binding protein [Clostridia bacterium]|nr:DNA-binding protein [Clostridia bacterium]